MMCTGVEQLTRSIPSPDEQRLEHLDSIRDSVETALASVSGPLSSLARVVCRTRFGAVTLVEEHEQRFAATQGFQLDRLAREHSFCAVAIEDLDDVTVIEDAARDPRFEDSPYVREDPGVRFYAGAPIATREGHGIGTVCAMDTQPRDLSPDQENNMRLLRRLGSAHVELQRRKDDLEEARRELSERTRELQLSNRELVNFANVISHEFKDPLTQVIGNLDLLELTLEPDPEGEIGELMQEAEKGADRMARLLKDVLAYARAGEQRAEPRTVHVDELVEDIAHELEPRIQTHQARIEIEPLPRARGDPEMIRLVLKNLISNAIKYRSENPPRIHVEGDEENEHVRISVKDNGIGIPEEDQDKLFEVFQRARHSKEREGTGVGLALVHRIVERHGGQIGVDSTPGEGSTFWFTLPAAHSHPPEPGGERSGSSTRRDSDLGPPED